MAGFRGWSTAAQPQEGITMTAAVPADPANESQVAQDAVNGVPEGGDTRAGQTLSREALEAELKRARDDAAKYRQRAREFGDDENYRRATDALAAVEKAENDKKSEVERLTEKSEGLLHRASSAEHDLLRLRVALASGVDSSQVDEFASRLRGDSEDELKADAEKLAQFFRPQAPQRRGDPSQGAGAAEAPNEDPLQAALESKLGLGR